MAMQTTECPDRKLTHGFTAGRPLTVKPLCDKRIRTSLCWAGPDTGKLTAALTLPSSGDIDDARPVVHEGLLWAELLCLARGKDEYLLG
jgi:hypothetical protein